MDEEKQTMTKKDLFAKFLAHGDVNLLSVREKRLATRISQGDTYEEIAIDFAVTKFRIEDIANIIKRKIERHYKVISRNAEFKSLLANLKAIKKPPIEIAIDGLFPFRFENALRSIEVKNLGDIVAKGYETLYRTKGIGKIGLRNIEEVLEYFGLEFPI